MDNKKDTAGASTSLIPPDAPSSSKVTNGGDALAKRPNRESRMESGKVKVSSRPSDERAKVEVAKERAVAPFVRDLARQVNLGIVVYVLMVFLRVSLFAETD